MIIRAAAYARIGLLGNPSDGYYGRTISCAITNFSATAHLEESAHVVLVPHPTYDPTEFDSLEALHDTARRDGYYGGLRLLYATCTKFFEYCRGRDIALPRRGFTLRYETTIPRQVGLAGSSAIVTATVDALRRLYGVTDAELPPYLQANLVLSVEEEELDIRAGLQDRVIQTYGGVVYMDFDRQLLESRGYGEYQRMDPALVPPLFLAYFGKPKDSGKMHSDVRARWHRGDLDVVEAMHTFALFATEGKAALERGDHEAFGRLMNRNFDLRLKIFGEKVIGKQNMEMIRIARNLGAPAKFSGSGGAIVGLWRDADQLARLGAAYRERGYSFTTVNIDPGERGATAGS